MTGSLDPPDLLSDPFEISVSLLFVFFCVGVFFLVPNLL